MPVHAIDDDCFVSRQLRGLVTQVELHTREIQRRFFGCGLGNGPRRLLKLHRAKGVLKPKRHAILGFMRFNFLSVGNSPRHG